MQITFKREGEWVRAKWRDDEGERGEALVMFAADGERFRIAVIQVAEPTAQKLRRVPLSRLESAVNVSGGFPAVGTEEAAKRLRRPRYRLKRPARRRLGDAFYANVARAYRDAVARGMHPRKTIVADTGAADTTVAEWIMEARRRGHLPPAEPGKVSA